MRIQQEIKFETFNDGIVCLHPIKDDGDMEEKPEYEARFGNRVVGETQHYGAMAAGVKISRRIRIPMLKNIDEDKKDNFMAVIGDSIYEIKRAQHYQGTNPPCTDLTLSLYKSKK